MRTVTRVVSTALAAAMSTAAAADLAGAIRTCAGLRHDSERLACYDRTAAQLAQGARAEAFEVAPEAMFGLSRAGGEPPRAGSAGGRDLRSIDARVKVLHQAADGSLTIELDNGQRWRQLDSKSLGLEAGDRVTISRAALGSFRIATADHRYGRVRRVQ